MVRHYHERLRQWGMRKGYIALDWRPPKLAARIKGPCMDFEDPDWAPMYICARTMNQSREGL